MTEKDDYITPVIFRKWNNGGIIALFPDDPYFHRYENEWMPAEKISSYEHVGQHGAADYSYVIAITKPATKEEYQDLFKELESIGYNLKVYQRRPKR